MAEEKIQRRRLLIALEGQRAGGTLVLHGLEQRRQTRFLQRALSLHRPFSWVILRVSQRDIDRRIGPYSNNPALAAPQFQDPREPPPARSSAPEGDGRELRPPGWLGYAPMDGPRPRVLVVEPDAAVRQAVRLACEGEGYLVSELAGGAGAGSRVESFQPDVVIVDVLLPDTSGFDICSELRRRGYRMPILILSSSNEEIDAVLGLEIGADDFV
ncbi:MAG: response regulator, partial [Isosphaeraceae bacterium]